jgi:hypothetical protein
MRRALILALGVLMLTAAPAVATDPSITDGSAQKALTKNRALWKLNRIHDYAFTFQASCFCPNTGPLRSVVHGKRARKPGITMERVFKYVQQAIDQKADSLKVTYGRYGIPRSMTEDQIEMAIDDEFSFTVTRFKRLRAR